MTRKYVLTHTLYTSLFPVVVSDRDTLSNILTDYDNREGFNILKEYETDVEIYMFNFLCENECEEYFRVTLPGCNRDDAKNNFKLLYPNDAIVD